MPASKKVCEMSQTSHYSLQAMPESGIPSQPPAAKDRAARISLLWVFVVFNYLYCDVLGLTDPNTLKDLLNGTGPVDVTAAFLLASGILMEIPVPPWS